MARFSVGDIAIVRNTVASCWKIYVGTEVEIIELNPFCARPCPYLVKCGDGLEALAEEHHLRRRDDKDDEKNYESLDTIWPPNRSQLSSWDRCVWRPKETVE